MRLHEDVKPISYLKANAAALIHRVSGGRKTYVITQNGEAKAVLMDLPSYEALRESVALLKILAQSTHSLKQKRMKPLRKAFADVRRLISRQNREAA